MPINMGMFSIPQLQNVATPKPETVESPLAGLLGMVMALKKQDEESKLRNAQAQLVQQDVKNQQFKQNQAQQAIEGIKNLLQPQQNVNVAPTVTGGINALTDIAGKLSSLYNPNPTGPIAPTQATPESLKTNLQNLYSGAQGIAGSVPAPTMTQGAVPDIRNPEIQSRLIPLLMQGGDQGAVSQILSSIVRPPLTQEGRERLVDLRGGIQERLKTQDYTGKGALLQEKSRLDSIAADENEERSKRIQAAHASSQLNNMLVGIAARESSDIRMDQAKMKNQIDMLAPIIGEEAAIADIVGGIKPVQEDSIAAQRARDAAKRIEINQNKLLVGLRQKSGLLGEGTTYNRAMTTLRNAQMAVDKLKTIFADYEAKGQVPPKGETDPLQRTIASEFAKSMVPLQATQKQFFEENPSSMAQGIQGKFEDILSNLVNESYVNKAGLKGMQTAIDELTDGYSQVWQDRLTGYAQQAQVNGFNPKNVLLESDKAKLKLPNEDTSQYLTRLDTYNKNYLEGLDSGATMQSLYTDGTQGIKLPARIGGSAKAPKAQGSVTAPAVISGEDMWKDEPPQPASGLTTIARKSKTTGKVQYMQVPVGSEPAELRGK